MPFEGDQSRTKIARVVAENKDEYRSFNKRRATRSDTFYASRISLLSQSRRYIQKCISLFLSVFLIRQPSAAFVRKYTHRVSKSVKSPGIFSEHFNNKKLLLFLLTHFLSFSPSPFLSLFPSLSFPLSLTSLSRSSPNGNAGIIREYRSDVRVDS